MRTSSTTETLPRQDQPSGDDPVLCWICGRPHLRKLATDRCVHKLHDRAALTARAALAGVGPRPLPVTQAEWEQLAQVCQQDGEDLVEYAKRRFWWLFARSLAASGYDLPRHVDWHICVRMELADETNWLLFGPDAMRALIARFGEPLYYRRTVPDLLGALNAGTLGGDP
jgi:hypothetical protein